VKAFPLALLPRYCPKCGKHAIVGHGQRRKQAHDESHDWIFIRRGLCRSCRVTFTILPTWSPPYGQYSLLCRQQAWESAGNSGHSWEHSATRIKDPSRLPDPATLRRWAFRRTLSLCCSLKVFWLWWSGWRTFWRAPTSLAWDWIALRRNLHLEASSP